MDQMEIAAVPVRMASESLSLSQASSSILGVWLLGNSKSAFPYLIQIQIKAAKCLPIKNSDYPILTCYSN
jgi:hypothetical protein